MLCLPKHKYQIQNQTIVQSNRTNNHILLAELKKCKISSISTTVEHYGNYHLVFLTQVVLRAVPLMRICAIYPILRTCEGCIIACLHQTVQYGMNCLVSVTFTMTSMSNVLLVDRMSRLLLYLWWIAWMYHAFQDAFIVEGNMLYGRCDKNWRIYQSRRPTPIMNRNKGGSKKNKHM